MILGFAACTLAAAAAVEAAGVLFLFFEQNSPAFLVVIFAAPALVIAMGIAYMHTEAKYK